MTKGKKGKENEKKKISHSGGFYSLHSQLQKYGMVIKNMDPDGNCLFRSLADQLFNNADLHLSLRKDIVQHIREREDYFKWFVEEDESLASYCNRMNASGVWGGGIELQACSELHTVNIYIHQDENLSYVVKNHSLDTNCLHLSYHGECHYNSVRPSQHLTGKIPKQTLKQFYQSTVDERKPSGVAESNEKEEEECLEELATFLPPGADLLIMKEALRKSGMDVIEAIEAYYLLIETTNKETITLKNEEKSDGYVNADENHRPDDSARQPSNRKKKVGKKDKTKKKKTYTKDRTEQHSDDDAALEFISKQIVLI